MLYQPDVLVVTETWLRPEIADSEILPSTHKMIGKDRDSRGGGVALIFKEEIEFVPLKECPNREHTVQGKPWRFFRCHCSGL